MPELYLGSEFPPELPVVPLRNTVLFPGGVLPMRLGPKSVANVRGQELVVVVAAIDAAQHDLTADNIYRVGTVAKLMELRAPQPDGQADATMHGLARCRFEVVAAGDHLRGRAQPLPEDPVIELPLGIETLRSLGLRIVHRWPEADPRALQLVRDIEQPVHLLDLIVANVELPVEQKQRVLETTALPERVAIAIPMLEQILQSLPPRPVEGARCPVHEMPAVAVCGRCGAFICAGCRGPGGLSGDCPACRARAAAPKPPTVFQRVRRWFG